MAEHHERALDRVRERFQADAKLQALMFVVDPAEMAGRRSMGALQIDASDLAQWSHGHIGGGVVDLAFLRAAAERGPEPSRFAFADARLLFARDEEIARLLPRVPVFQESERLEKMRSFVSQLPVHLSYLQLGDLSHNAWLLSQTATELVFFAGRLILEHNRILYGNRKQFMAQLASAAEKPESMVEAAQELMRAPSIARARAFYDLVMAYRDWPVAPEGPWSRFSRDRETNWVEGQAALADS